MDVSARSVGDRAVRQLAVRLIYFLFFCSGFSALVYQVVWVRVFGNVFGSTVYSASLVLAVFMLGLGAGGYLGGWWADRRHGRNADPALLVRDYGCLELAIGLMGFGVAGILPHLGRLSALVSSYSQDANGWHALSLASYLARAGICSVLLAPIAMLMGATLTLLIRYLVWQGVSTEARRIALLYGVNTLGAALGCFLTDYALVPMNGLHAAQMVAVSINLAAAVAALAIGTTRSPTLSQLPRFSRRRGAGLSAFAEAPGQAALKGPRHPHAEPAAPRSAVVLTSLALGLSGFAAMGMEIVWFRHFTLLLGPLRAVYSLLMTVVLLGLGTGSLVAGLLNRMTSRTVECLIAAQGLLVALTLWTLSVPSTGRLSQAAVAIGRVTEIESEAARRWAELWFNLQPMLVEAFGPALLMGLMFPLANAMIQRGPDAVGRRAGWLYLSNTVGAVLGVLAAGFLLVPALGIQTAAAILTTTAWLAVVPLVAAALAVTPRDSRSGPRLGAARTAVLAASLLVAAFALWTWQRQPSTYLIGRALLRPSAGERLLAIDEGVNEVVAVTEFDGDHRRWLLTNGYPMSSTGPVEQRYMRALAHIPLLSVEAPETVLVIGFGVGNTAHAATLHPSVRRVEIADLSREILAAGRYFRDTNRGVLDANRVAVFVNDGRQHLQMQPPASYDLITLEPPPIAHAGVAALYSTDFYRLARTRLKANGLISQWLPAYQVPVATSLAVLRAFLDVFPRAVLLSGAQPNLLLVGANQGPIEIDPARLADALAAAPEVRTDLERVDLGSVREIVGTFVGSSRTLLDATRYSSPVSDDRPLQEYSVRSLINFGLASVPASIVDLTRLDEWCPRCFEGDRDAPAVEGLSEYMAVLGRAYMVPTTIQADLAAPSAEQLIAGSNYLRMLLRNAAEARNRMGVQLASEGRSDEAVEQFREALRLRPELKQAQENLAAALAGRGAPEKQ
jgi:spermidine synthase